MKIFSRTRKKRETAQTLLDYILLLGIVSTVLFAMNTSIRRGVQAVVKGAADHIGRQEDADQDFEGRGGYLVQSISNARVTRTGEKKDFLGRVEGRTQETTVTQSDSLTNLGVLERAD